MGGQPEPAGPGYHLVLGNKNYSSWSLRAWLTMRQANIPFDETVIPLFQDSFSDEIREHSSAGRVPVLHHKGRTIWDTLAIVEYLAEMEPAAGIWPADTAERAVARSICAEMHAGFAALRDAMPMNVRRTIPGVAITPAIAKDIDRITDIWRTCRAAAGGRGDFLFGSFCAADAFYAPVVNRFATYGVVLDQVCEDYSEAVLTLGAMTEWTKAGRAETWVIEEDEVRI